MIRKEKGGSFLWTDPGVTQVHSKKRPCIRSCTEILWLPFWTAGGRCRICEPQFLPYSLYLEEAAEDFDLCLQNLSNFYFWCASRVLTLDRVYAKEILNSIGAPQGTTDRERAQIALSYHCLSLADIFWVREEGETVTFSELNLYENSLSNAFVDVALKGRQMTIENRDLIADDLSVSGMFPKAWVRGRGWNLVIKRRRRGCGGAGDSWQAGSVPALPAIRFATRGRNMKGRRFPDAVC